MAKRQSLNRSQVIRDYLDSNPGAKPLETVTALRKQGITVTTALVSKIKARVKNSGNGKKPAKVAAVVTEAPAVVEKPSAKNGSTITLEHVKKVAQTVKALGGYQKMTEVLEVIKEAGGVKKFKDLAEAMTVVETDAVPY